MVPKPAWLPLVPLDKQQFAPLRIGNLGARVLDLDLLSGVVF